LVALLVVAPSPCFALWEISQVNNERAKELGMEIRSKAAGPKAVRLELEVAIKGKLKKFSRVDLRISEGDKSLVTAPLREDRSKPGRVIVGFAADRAHLDKIALWVMVPDTMPGGTIYELRVKDFAELDKPPTKAGEQGRRLPQDTAEQSGAAPPAAIRCESK